MKRPERNSPLVMEKAICIEINFPCSREKLFNFVADPKNMTLYKGFGLLPGISSVQSTPAPRIQGTIDLILNTDRSTHKSKTSVFDVPNRYFVEISNIQVPGLKGQLSRAIVQLAEEWNFASVNDANTKVIRRLLVFHKSGWLHEAMVTLLLLPQLKLALHRHHLAILSAVMEKRIN